MSSYSSEDETYLTDEANKLNKHVSQKSLCRSDLSNLQNFTSLRQNDYSYSTESISSFSSASSSSTDLCSPPKAFRKMAEIQPNPPKKTYQIRYKKSRWEPMTKEEEKKRMRALKNTKKRERKEKKKRKRKGKMRKDMDNEFHQGKDHFHSLTHFLKNRKRMAEELLDSIDLETRYEIFPEIEDKSDAEVHELVYCFLKGMSRKRILAIMQGVDFSKSSSTKTDAIDEEELGWNEEEEGINGMEMNGNEFEKLEEENDEEEKRQREYLLRKMTLKRKERMEKERKMKEKKKAQMELEEGEILSEDENDDDDDERVKEISNSSKNGGGQNSQKDDENGAEEELNSSNGRPKSNLEDGNEHRIRMNAEPKFIISLNCSSPPTSLAFNKLYDGSDEDGKNFEQKIVCILPPSPVELSQNQNVEEEDGTKIQRENSPIDEKMDNEDEELIVKIDSGKHRQQENQIEGSKDPVDVKTADDASMIDDDNEKKNDEVKVIIEDYEEPDIELVDD